MHGIFFMHHRMTRTFAAVNHDWLARSAETSALEKFAPADSVTPIYSIWISYSIAFDQSQFRVNDWSTHTFFSLFKSWLNAILSKKAKHSMKFLINYITASWYIRKVVRLQSLSTVDGVWECHWFVGTTRFRCASSKFLKNRYFQWMFFAKHIPPLSLLKVVFS